MKLKPGVDIRGLKPEIVLAMMLIEPILNRHTPEGLVVTSVKDGKHMPTSLHYQGLAFDIRTRDMQPVMIKACLEEIKGVLGYQFDVVFEGDHIHVEFDPKE